ncbi:MAG: hypothetical protein GX217_01110 [Clostridiaceae bacterium]|nr:hypothetical protein [Clostridiaceae bacterium]
MREKTKSKILTIVIAIVIFIAIVVTTKFIYRPKTEAEATVLKFGEAMTDLDENAINACYSKLNHFGLMQIMSEGEYNLPDDVAKDITMSIELLGWPAFKFTGMKTENVSDTKAIVTAKLEVEALLSGETNVKFELILEDGKWLIVRSTLIE